MVPSFHQLVALLIGCATVSCGKDDVVIDPGSESDTQVVHTGSFSGNYSFRHSWRIGANEGSYDTLFQTTLVVTSADESSALRVNFPAVANTTNWPFADESLIFSWDEVEGRYVRDPQSTMEFHGPAEDSVRFYLLLGTTNHVNTILFEGVRQQ